MLNIAICDDNKSHLTSVLSKVKLFFENKNITTNISYFFKEYDINKLDMSKYELFLLDVEMKSINGINLGEHIRTINPNAAIIYISGFLSYAIWGYNVNALAYILKSDPQFDKNLYRALDKFLNEKYSSPESLTVKISNEECKIFLKDIIYIESFSRKLTSHLKSGKTIEFYGKISDMDKTLSEKGFIKIHKSYLVNMDYINKISSYKTYIDNNIILPTSTENYSSITKKFALWKGNK